MTLPISAEMRGNTFLIFDYLDGSLPNWKEIHSLLIASDKDDALVLLPTQGLPYLKMAVFGQDSAFGEFCGNGSRAVASYLLDRYPEYTKFFLETPWGICPIDFNGTSIPLQGELSPFVFQGRTFLYGEAIEPHLTLEGEISDEEFTALAKELQPLFPNGINVNAWQTLGSNKIFVKTYERGVQRLTQSCGTGSSVSVLAYLKGSEGLVEVITPGGALHVLIEKNHLNLIDSLYA